jgi:hypothetical protein
LFYETSSHYLARIASNLGSSFSLPSARLQESTTMPSLTSCFFIALSSLWTSCVFQFSTF